MRHLQKFGTTLLFASCLAALPALAQTTGSIAGTISSAVDSKPIPDAVVIATSPSLQGEQTAVTDDKGAFEITLLPSGSYQITVQREGFKTFQQGALLVRIDKVIRIQLPLQPDTLAGETIVISSSAPTTINQSEQTGVTFDSHRIDLIPSGAPGVGRGFEQLLTSVPGVHTDAVGLQMNGSGGPENGFVIDGVMVNDPAVGTQGTTLLQNFIEEVDVKTGGYQAEYGRATGGIVNVVTKSGGNEFHGSVFVDYSPYEAPRKQIGSPGLAIAAQSSQRFSLDFGAELGGPILKDKLWFYAGFAPQILSTNTNRIIRAQTDNGSGRAVTDANGVPLTHDIASKTYQNSATSYQFTGKLTYLLNENHTLALAVYGDPTTKTGAQGGAGLGYNANEGAMIFDTPTGSTDVSLRYSGKLLNKTMLVEATGAYHHQFGGGNAVGVNFVPVGSSSAAALQDTPGVIWRGLHNLLYPGFANDPTVPGYQQSAAVQQGCAIDANGFDPCPVSNYSTGGVGYVSNTKLDRVGGVLKLSNFVELLGHHQFKYGIDGAKDTFNQDKFFTGGQLFQALQTNGVVTRYFGIRGFGHADPNKPGLPSFNSNGTLAGGTVNTNTQNTSVAAFAQDSWNIADRVVLDLGVRAEKQLMYADPNSLDAGGNKVGGAQINLTNVMPRIGLVYDFTGRGLSKVYASYGRFYEYVPLDLADRALSAETSANYTTNAQNCTNPQDPRSCSVLAGGQGGGRTYRFIGGAAGDAVDPKLKGQYADEYQGGIQYQAYRDVSVGVDYVHKSLGRVIEDMSVDDGNTYFLSNPGVPGAAGYSGTTASGLTVLEPPPRRVYDGVTFSVNKNFSENYLVAASYTYSQFRGNYPGLFNGATGQLDPNILSEYDLLSLLPNKDGPLPGDIPNAFKVDTAYLYPISEKASLQLGGNLHAQEGTPINTLGAHPLYGPSEAFVLPRGSGGRLPWTWALNLRAGANYKVSKDYNLGVTVDLFNVTDNRTTTQVDQNYTFDSVSPIVNGKSADLAFLKTTTGAPATVNPQYLTPTAYQLPFSARLGARLSF